MTSSRCRPLAGLAALAVAAPAFAQSFVNWETPHVSPIDVTPDGGTLLAVNTADNRLEVFSIGVGGSLLSIGAVPVGLDPVSVRARSSTEAWVVNHVSDSVSIVDLQAMNVVATLHPGDEPADVVFAGEPERAFVTVSQENEVVVYDPADPTAAPTVLTIEGEDPRALATDGSTVYAAIFEAGNETTILAQTVVSSAVNPYPQNQNPPPNVGTGFDPPQNPANPDPPAVSLVVRKDANGAWLDDNGGDWSSAVTWDLHGHDVAVIDANGLTIEYATGLMNINMALGVRPGGGVTVVGTEAINELRFEPNLNGIFVQVVGAHVTGPGAGSATDLNPHLDYTAPTVDQALRDQSIGDPRGVAWTPDGATALITGMGSNNVIAVDGGLVRTGRVEVGEGPTGVVMSADGGTAWVLNKFEGSISTVDVAGLSESARTPFHDPTPAAIRDGRPFLYDTHRTSGLGHVACASCHVDGRMDQLAWDLGAPDGDVKPFNQVCNGGFGGCEDWHPMKGPMATQTLVGILGTGPLHWRGDREDLAAFNGAFELLLGDDTQLTNGEMQAFEDFVGTMTVPPNPFREHTGFLPTTFPNGGNPAEGQSLFLTAGLDGVNCVTCHAQPTGTNGQLTSAALLQETQSIKIPQLRNMHEKTGFDSTSQSNNRGFGFIHDGSVDTMFEFLTFPGFQFQNDQQRLDVEAFMMAFATDTFPAVGAQLTLPLPVGAAEVPDLDTLVVLAESDVIGLVAKGVVNGEHRGYHLAGPDLWQSDRADETLDEATLLGQAAAGGEITITAVPEGSELRIGVDRDEDGYLDRDELDAGSNPADAASTPDNVVAGDLNGDGAVDTIDFLALLGAWGPCPAPPAGCPADLDGDGIVDTVDFLALLANWTG